MRLVGLALVCLVIGASPYVRQESRAKAQTPGPGELLDRVLALVGGQVILLSDVRAFLDLQLITPSDAADPTPSVLTALIERRLVLEEEARYVAVEPPPSDAVDERLAEVVRRVGGAEALDARLPVVGLTIDDLRQVLREDLLIERYLARRWPPRPPTDNEVAAYFRDHADEFRTDGVLPSFDAARDEARRRASEGQRQALIDDWVASLTERGNVLRVTP